jgi:hypothetical protein
VHARPQLREERVLELEGVLRRVEVGDRVTVRRRKRAVEDEDVVARAADQDVIAEPAENPVVAVALTAWETTSG